MKWLTQFVALTLVIACGTWFAAWWTVPVVGAAYGAWAAAQRAAVLTAALSAAVAWGALLAYDAAVGPAARLAHVFAELFHLPGGTLAIVTLAYAALLASSAAALARGIRRLATPAA